MQPFVEIFEGNRRLNRFQADARAGFIWAEGAETAVCIIGGKPVRQGLELGQQMGDIRRAPPISRGRTRFVHSDLFSADLHLQLRQAISQKLLHDDKIFQAMLSSKPVGIS